MPRRSKLLCLAVLLLALAGSCLAVGTASAVEPVAGPEDPVKPATGPEDVPKLDEDVGGKAVPKPKSNRPPKITSVTITPKRAVVGVNVVRLPVSGDRATVKVTVTAEDPDGDELTYTYSDNSASPDEKLPYNTVGYTPKKPTVIELTVTVKDPFGAEDKATVIIPVFDPVDDLVNAGINERERLFRSLQQQGALVAGVTSLPGESFERVFDSEEDAGAPAVDTATPAAVLDGPAPWQDARVQQCVRQYLQQVAFPAENRLSPGTFTQIDEWGRLLGPNLRATGPVEGMWDNPAHFVWSQFGSARATSRYGISLGDYVRACLEGRPLPMPSETAAASPKATGPAAAPPAVATDTEAEQRVVELYNQAKAAIQEGNTSARNNDPASAKASYQRALDALRRAQREGSAGNYARELTSAIALVERNIARTTAKASSDIARREDAIATGKGCTALVGSWKWFNGATVVCRRDGTCAASNGYQGNWRCTGEHGRFEISWSRQGKGVEFVDTVSLSDAGRRITGKNQFGASVSAARQASAPASDGGRQTGTKTPAQKPACNWRFTGMVSDHTADDDQPFSFSAIPVPARCHPGYAGNTATCWDGVRIRHPGSPTRAWCTYKHVPKSAYGRGGNAGKVYECVCR